MQDGEARCRGARGPALASDREDKTGTATDGDARANRPSIDGV